MPETKAWVLTDVGKRIWVDQFELTARDAGLEKHGPWTIRKQTLRGGLADGVDLIEVDNGSLSFAVAPTRGMGIWQGQHEGDFLGWHAPVVGPVHPKFVNLMERGGLGWLQGFDEWIVRCGLDSNGAPGTDVVIDNEGNKTEVELTLHGRIANQPAHRVEVHVTPGDPPELAIVGHVDEAMLFSPSLRLVTKISTSPGSNRMTIRDEVINLRGVEAELELLYHCNFGKPLLEAGARMLLPSREVAPRAERDVEELDHYDTYRAPTPGYVEAVYWFDPAADSQGQTLALLRNARGDKGAVLRFNKRQLPCFTLWKNTAAESDGYVTGLEPATNYPNPKAFERSQGRVVKIPPGNSYGATLAVELHANAAGVRAAEKEIEAVQGDTPPKVHDQPHPKYSPT